MKDTILLNFIGVIPLVTIVVISFLTGLLGWACLTKPDTHRDETEYWK